jgi:hypothetical protein
MTLIRRTKLLSDICKEVTECDVGCDDSMNIILFDEFCNCIGRYQDRDGKWLVKEVS